MYPIEPEISKNIITQMYKNINIIIILFCTNTFQYTYSDNRRVALTRSDISFRMNFTIPIW